MIKHICDICQKEFDGLTQRNEFGSMTVQEKSFDFANKKRTAEQIMKNTSYIFCVDCAKELRDHGVEKRKKLEKPKDETKI